MNPSGNDLVTVVVLGGIGWRLFGGLRHAFSGYGRDRIVEIVGGIRWRHIWPVPFVLTGVFVVATLLVQVPGLSWGWWSAFGGEGNPVFGSNQSTSGTAWEWIIPGVFMLMLIPALPLFAYAEEQAFRSGAEFWSRWRRVYKVVSFGLAHALIGIPIGTALALSVGGAYFMNAYLHQYRLSPSGHEATLASTRAHTAYNGIIVGVVVIAVLASLL